MADITTPFSKINAALSGPGPQTDHSIHTTTQLPPHPVASAPGSGTIHGGTGSWDALRAGKNGPKPY